MLSKFAVSNYRGFEKRIEFNLASPRDYDFNLGAVKDGIIKNGIIYGPNGCGKTNLGLAIFDIVNHLSQKYHKPDYYKNFVFAGNADAPVCFEYTFRFGSDTLEYSYSKNKEGVFITEKLSVNNQVAFEKSNKELFIDEFYNIHNGALEGLKGNANNVSIASFLLASVPLEPGHYLVKLQSFVNSMLWFRSVENTEFTGLETGASYIEADIISSNAVDKFSKFLEEVSDQHFDFVKPQKGDTNLFCKFNGSKVAFNLIASTGTKSLRLLFYWLLRLKSASFVFVDEFDAFYHFKLAYAVCKELFSYDCQVFLSSHNTYLMTNDLLRPDCNFIIGDNKIKPLCDCTEKELRFGHNIEKLFRGDAFII